jgi:hypothetical protein
VVIQNNLKFEGAIAREENIDFLLRGCQILPDIPFLRLTIAKLYMSRVNGRIGWPLFQQMNCFFDFPNSVMFVAKDMKTLQDEAGCALDGFVKTSFDLSHCGLIVSVETDLGRRRFLLDTGSTWSLFKNSQVEKKGRSFTTDKFQIGGTDFGKTKFCLYEFSDLFEVDGVLGVDFFKRHAICIDFHNKIAYINPSRKSRFIFK